MTHRVTNWFPLWRGGWLIPNGNHSLPGFLDSCCAVVALVSRDREDGRETQLSEERADQLQPVIATLLLSLALWLGIWGIVTLLVSIEL